VKWKTEREWRNSIRWVWCWKCDEDFENSGTSC